MDWKKYKEEKPSEGEEVLAYHPSWIDEDFNPRGIRIGFWNGELFFVDDEYAGTVKLTNLDNGESNISFPSCDDGLIINPADKHIK